MATGSRRIDPAVKTLAISLQRQKTAMEMAGLQDRFWATYWKLSETIWELEEAAGISAPALRDEADEQGLTSVP